MDQALTQRLVGAAVITALAAIFVPMFFEDSGEEQRHEVSSEDLAVPAAPIAKPGEDNPIPQSPQQVLHAPEGETLLTEEPSETKTDGAPVETPEQAEPETPEEGEASVAEEDFVEPAPPSKPSPQPKPVTEIQDKPKAKPATNTPAKTANVAAQDKAPKPQEKLAALSPPSPIPTSKKPGLQRWVVQVASLSKKDSADSLVAKLLLEGFNAYAETVQKPGVGTMYRVRVGPELDKQAALATQKKLKQQNTVGMVVAE